MNSDPPARSVAATMPPATPAQISRLYHTGVAASLILLMLWGFQHFYFQGRSYPGREIPPPIRTLVILHGVSMAGWLVLLQAQALLIMTRKRKVHVTLGKIGAVLAVVIVAAGYQLGIESTRIAPPEMRIWGLSPKQFMIVPIGSIVLFAGLVTAGVMYRRRPELHRTLMLLATLTAIPAAVSRIDPISALYAGTVWATWFGPFFATAVIAVLFLCVKSALTRSVDRYYAVGCVALIASFALIMGLAPTGAWDSVARFLLR
jgi:hypothetical protein